MTTENGRAEYAKRILGKKRASEDQCYKKFFNEYKQAEKEREKSRKQRGCLAKNWQLEDLHGKDVLIVGENGIGDEILAIGCLSKLAPQCRHVIWYGDSKLQNLFSRSFSGVEFVSRSCHQPIADGTIYSCELIGRFRSSLDEFDWTKKGAFTAYLEPPASLKARLQARYADG